MNNHFTLVEEFGCLNDPWSYVAMWLYAPDSVTQGKLVLSDGPDKAQLKADSNDEKYLGHPASL